MTLLFDLKGVSDLLYGKACKSIIQWMPSSEYPRALTVRCIIRLHIDWFCTGITGTCHSINDQTSWSSLILRVLKTEDLA